MQSTQSANENLPQEHTGDRLLSISDVCRAARRGKTWIVEASRSGTFPAPTKIAGRLFWSDREIQQWIADRLSERSGQ